MLEVMTIERWAQLLWRAAHHECEITYVPREVIRRQESLKDYEAPLARPLPSIQDLSKPNTNSVSRLHPSRSGLA